MADLSGSINQGSQLPLSLSAYIQQLLKRQPNFGPIQRAYGQQYSHPSLQTGPNGAWLDPMQMQQEESRNYLGERGDIASEDLSNKFSLVDLLTKNGRNYASMQNAFPFLEAQNIGGGGFSPLSMFGGGF